MSQKPLLFCIPTAVHPTSDFLSLDPARTAMNYCLVEPQRPFDPLQCRVVGVDGNIMVVAHVATEVPPAKRYLVDGKTLEAIGKVRKGYRADFREDSVTVWTEGHPNQAEKLLELPTKVIEDGVNAGGTTLKFPDYVHVLPGESDYDVRPSTKTMPELGLDVRLLQPMIRYMSVLGKARGNDKDGQLGVVVKLTHDMLSPVVMRVNPFNLPINFESVDFIVMPMRTPSSDARKVEKILAKKK